jgi:iron complex outermembrane receptor protein
MSTRRFDGGFVGQTLVNGKYLVAARGALANQRHDHQFGENRERDSHRTMFAEVTVRSSIGKHTVVVGTAIEHDGYAPTDVPQFEFKYWIPGVFGQVDMELRPWVSISGSARLDHHNEYGTFVSPRLSALFRSGKWTSRMSLGTGFFGPSPLTEETEAAGLTRLVVPEALRAERGQSASVDVTRTHGPFTATFTLFGSRIEHPISVDRSAGLELRNLVEPATNTGVELLGTFRREPFSVTATYSFVKSREVIDGLSRDVALTPRHNAGLVAMWEREDVGRVGVEFYFTGRQRLEENPFSAESQSYLILGLLAERQFGRFRLFINGENLTGVRQTKWDPLIRPTRAPDGRWTVDAWAPLEGRNINGGVRLAF